MAGTAVVAMPCPDGHLHGHVPAMAEAVRALLAADRGVVLMSPAAVAGAATLAIGTTRSGRRAVPVVAHTLVDPADPAFAHPDGALDPAPLGILEAEGIAALVASGFPVVVAGCEPVVPYGDARGSGGVPRDARGSGGVPRDARGSGGVPRDDEYQPVTAVLDDSATAQRLAGDIGALALIFIVGDDEVPPGDGLAVGEIDLAQAECRLAAEARLAPELRAAVRFLRAGGEVAVITTAGHAAAALDSAADRSGMLRIHRELTRPRSDAPVLAAGWC